MSYLGTIFPVLVRVNRYIYTFLMKCRSPLDIAKTWTLGKFLACFKMALLDPIPADHLWAMYRISGTSLYERAACPGILRPECHPPTRVLSSVCAGVEDWTNEVCFSYLWLVWRRLIPCSPTLVVNTGIAYPVLVAFQCLV